MAKLWVFNADENGDWDETQQEIATLLAAVSSYPARAALNPDIDFEQHLVSVLAMGESYLFPAGCVN